MGAALDPAGIVALLVSVVFISLLVGARLKGAGASRSLLWTVLIQIWVTIGVWIAVFYGITLLLGANQSEERGSILGTLGQKVAAGSGVTAVWCIVLFAVAVASLVLLLWRLKVVLREPPPAQREEESGE